MHVREEIEQRRPGWKYILGFHSIVRIAGWNLEPQIVPTDRQRTLRWLLLREHKPDLGVILGLLAAGGVVNLKHQVASRLNHFTQAGPPDLRNFPRRVDHQYVVAAAGDVVEIATRGHERNPGLRVA